MNLSQPAPEVKGLSEDNGSLPRISVVVPMYNEREYIENCLDSVLAQEYPSDKLEVHVVDGNSRDGSAELVSENYSNKSIPVFLHGNPQRKTSTSLNVGIKAATGDIVVILGAHTALLPRFLTLNAENLRLPNVYCTGGTQVNAGTTRMQASIGAAMSHWFGMASAPYRYRGKPGFVNTVVYGAYRREVFELVGYFDEKGSISEDSELNWRIIKSGFKIYFDPRIKTLYHPRKSLSQLAKQMFTYGILRSRVFRKHLGGVLWLHFVPPVGLLVLLALGVLSYFVPGAGPYLVGVTLIYLSMGIGCAFHAYYRHRKNGNPLIVFLSFIVLHLFWSLGFLWGLVTPRSRL